MKRIIIIELDGLSAKQLLAKDFSEQDGWDGKIVPVSLTAFRKSYA